jgi:hypothetical protein
MVFNAIDLSGISNIYTTQIDMETQESTEMNKTGFLQVHG